MLHDWCHKGHGMYYICGMMHIKEPLLLIGKSSLCGGSGFPLLLSEWFFTICLTPYNHKSNVLSVSLYKTFPSFPIGELLGDFLIFNIKKTTTKTTNKQNPLPPPHGLLFSISSNRSFICITQQTGEYIPQLLSHQLWSTGWNMK